MLKKITVAISLSIALLQPASALDLAQENSIWDLKTGERINAKSLVDALSASETILLGESHGNAGHQNREAFLLGALAEREVYPALALEMLNPSQNVVINNFRTLSPEDTDGLGQALSWENSGWPNFSFYKPVFDIAFASKLPIFGADLDEAKKTLAREELMNDQAGLEIIDSWRQTMYAAHCELIDADELEKVSRLQIRRDRFIARQVEELSPVVLIAGSEHVRKDRGIPRLLKSGGRNSVSLLFLSATIPQDGKQEKLKKLNSDQYDFVWVTEAQTELGTCERLRQKGLIK